MKDSGTELPDSGLDAGDGVDAGGDMDAGEIADAGERDGGEVADAGTGEQDGGEVADAGAVDGGEAPDGGCGPSHALLYQVKAKDIGWPVNWPSCYSGTPADCTNILVERFATQVELDTFFTNELQMTAPTVNFNLADAMVAYSCACPTYGYTLDAIGVTSDGCTVELATEFQMPDESCLTWQTFSRPFVLVEIEKDGGVGNSVVHRDIMYSCGP
ncbi:MAG: hypothetical protein IRZ16_05480 [Myxococcaceae bacterium]|nr:hypothetical protein [Myxococcaceae bacterium]